MNSTFRSIEWLFIDVGGVLLDDRPLMDALYRFYADWFQNHGYEVSHQQLIATRDRLEAEGKSQVYKRVLELHAPSLAIARAALEEFRAWLRPRQFELNPLLPGVPDALDVLNERFRLALAANQGSYIHGMLEQHGIRNHFEQVYVAGELGVSKPDPRFFEAMLHGTGANPAHSVMIGDSFANDIQPAADAGMQAILIERSNELGFLRDSVPVASSLSEAVHLLI